MASIVTCGMRHHRHVRARHLGDRRAGPLRHASLDGRRDHEVLGADHRPARDGLPRRGLRRGDVGAERDRALAGGDQPPVGLGQILREGVVDGRRLEERLGVAFGSAGIADDVEHRRRVGDVECGARSAEDLEDVLAHLGDEGIDVDERLHVATAGSGVRDHHAAVGVTDQDDGTGRALSEERGDVRGVARHAAEEVGWREDGEALSLELGRHRVPAPTVRPCSVNEDDRRLGHDAPVSAGRHRRVPAP